MLVLDNATYHKATSIRHWLQRHQDRITVCWLPTSSPQLNLIERLWRLLKARLPCHRLWNDLTGLIHLANTILHRANATFGAPPRPHLWIEG